MAQSKKTAAQDYPKIEVENSKEFGCLDDWKLDPHVRSISDDELEALIAEAVDYANLKSSRAALEISDEATEEDRERAYVFAGKELFVYFKKYCDDPASTSQQINGKSYRDVCAETFRNRLLQKQRMNSGWRYQHLAKDCANVSKRFLSVSDLNQAEADFNAAIGYVDKIRAPLTLYVSVKNRKNTLGGQDWPKAIHALEQVASGDKNRKGAYCCVFGIAMDRGKRTIKRSAKTGQPHSPSTEVWLSDFFWPFFSNRTYDDIMNVVLRVLMKKYPRDGDSYYLDIPEKIYETFLEYCKKQDIVDEKGIFHDPYKLVNFFCTPLKKSKKVPSKIMLPPVST